MRAFSFIVALAGRVGRSLPAALSVSLALTIVLPADASAQWPGEIEIVVVDASTGHALSQALVETVRGSSASTTGGDGRVRFGGLQPGIRVLAVQRLGYVDARVAVEVTNGMIARAVVRLVPDPIQLDEVRVLGSSSLEAGGTFISRARLAASGARTIGQLVGELPGVVVTERSRGGPATASIRGSSPDAVLVLVDGAPLNDPITGEADLGALAAGSVESVTVLPGAQAARFGSGAEAGVILIESRRAIAGLEASLGVGSLGRLAGGVDGGVEVGGAHLGAGFDIDHVGGGFDFDLPPEVGGGPATRRNADAQLIGGRVVLSAPWWGGDGSVSLGYDDVRRGVPGKAFSPTSEARQRLGRARFSAAWNRASGRTQQTLASHGTVQDVRFVDHAPASGPPYDNRTRVAELGARADLSRRLDWTALRSAAGGIDVRTQRIRSDALDLSAPGTRTDLAAHARALIARPGEERRPDAASPEVSLVARAHFDGLSGTWHASHDVTVRTVFGPVSTHVAHRSAFTPPTLGDQFFQEGVGVAPNPELRAERVPHELELGVRWEGTGAWRPRTGITAYVGDVRDMIVWQPDFRFVWSPRNTNVDRRGLDAWAEVVVPAARLVLGGDYSWARVTYARGGDARPVQVAYRPRVTGRIWARSWDLPVRFEVGAHHVGARNPVPSPANPLPGFWSLTLDASRDFSWDGWTLRPSIRVDRLLDSKQSLIFGFPDPGRSVLLSVFMTQESSQPR